MERLTEFVQNNVWLVITLLVSWAAVMFYEIRLKSQGLSQVSTVDALRVINKGATIIDVRSAEAFGNGHIVNARNIGLDALASGQPPIKRKNRAVLTVCDNGSASGKAASSLRRAGYENVYSLKGGLNHWRAENLPLVK